MLRYCLLLSCVLFAYASDVLEFDDSNFDENIKKHDIILVEFYAPWCGHCKALAPKYEEAATILKNDDPPVPLAKVDCIDAGKDTCSRFSVSGFPTLKIFKNGEFSMEYGGNRETDGIVKYMRSKAGPSTKELHSKSDLEKVVSKGATFFAGFFKSMDGKLAKEFLKLADKNSENFKFVHSTSEEVLTESRYSDQVVMYRNKKMLSKFEPDVVIFEGSADVSEMQKFLESNVHGLAGQRTQSNTGDFKHPLITAFYDVDYEKNPKGTNYWRNRVLKVAKKLSEEGLDVHFSIGSHKELSHEMGEMGEDFSVKDDGKPVIGARDAKGQKFTMTEEFSMDNLEAFARAVLAGTLEPYLKSEPVPESQEEPVKVVVAKNFDEIVNDPERDVLIEFYAPWCGHCKNLAPKYDELAKKLKSEPGITIAKMDATANDVPSPYEVQGFPTLYFAPKDRKNRPKSYQGGREVKDFIEYLAREATDPLKGYDRQGKKLKKAKKDKAKEEL